MNQYIRHDKYIEMILLDKNKKEKARTLIDFEDFELVIQYHWGFDRYVTNWKIGSLHRFLMNCPTDKVVDHINGNVLDNRRNNLRITDIRHNSINKKVMSNSKTGIAGVTWNKYHNKWRATITVDGKCKYLGYFDNINDAINVRHQAEIKYFGEYRCNRR